MKRKKSVISSKDGAICSSDSNFNSMPKSASRMDAFLHDFGFDTLYSSTMSLKTSYSANFVRWDPFSDSSFMDWIM